MWNWLPRYTLDHACPWYGDCPDTCVMPITLWYLKEGKKNLRDWKEIVPSFLVFCPAKNLYPHVSLEVHCGGRSESSKFDHMSVKNHYPHVSLVGGFHCERDFRTKLNHIMRRAYLSQDLRSWLSPLCKDVSDHYLTPPIISSLSISFCSVVFLLACILTTSWFFCLFWRITG